MRLESIVSVVVGFAILLLTASPARSQAPFYEGKSITIVIGTAGGGSIVAARIIAQHIGKYIRRKAQIDFQHIPAAEVLTSISAILQQPGDVQQEIVKYIKFGGWGRQVGMME